MQSKMARQPAPRLRALHELRRLAALRHAMDPISPEYRELMWLEQDLVDRLRHPAEAERGR